MGVRVGTWRGGGTGGGEGGEKRYYNMNNENNNRNIIKEKNKIRNLQNEAINAKKEENNESKALNKIKCLHF